MKPNAMKRKMRMARPCRARVSAGLVVALRGLCLTVLVAMTATRAVALEQVVIPEIPYEKFVLENGLTVIIHEDHKSPIVAVNVWYHVGSKNEGRSRTGFAHLFEHLMFNGSEHFDDDYFKPFERVGATDMNGTTDADRTNYFQNVPATALELALWMESDRMCCMKPAVSQARLDEQRGVVQNEKRQGRNQPYGEVFDLIQENTYPEGHPYDHTVIGSMQDLNSASLEDVHAWFDTYYGPNNATLVIAGDVDTRKAIEKVRHYFAGIAPGPPIQRQSVWIAKRDGPHRQLLQDRVPQARIYKAWNVPELTDPTTDYLSLFADVLGTGKNSRLYRRLVHQDRSATEVEAFVFGRELGSLFIVSVTAQPGADIAAVERALEDEMHKLLQEGLTAAELDRIKTRYLGSFVRGLERIGGFGGKSDVLAFSEVYYGSPDGYRRMLRTVQTATTQEILRAARNWLRQGVYTLEVQPYPALSAANTDVQRDAGPPLPNEFPRVDFPETEHAQLANGLNVIVAHRPAVPVVELSLLVDAGFAADHGGKPGTADLALNMMDEAAGGMSALEIADRLSRLGATIQLGSNLDTSFAALSALKANLAPSLALYADVVLRPSFPEDELARLRAQQLALIRQEMAEPFSLALRLFPRLIYDDSHAYSIPFTGSGTAESVRSIAREDLVRFHQAWFKPNNATLVVAGDTRMQDIKPLVEKHFGAWKSGDTPKKNVVPQDVTERTRIYVADRPGAEQSVIIVGHVAPPYDHPQKLALECANAVLGGSFTARLNMNLREDKHWSYGARSIIVDARGPRPFFVNAPVQTDKTSAAMGEIQQELAAIAAQRPPTFAEVERVKERNILMLPGRWETSDAIIAALAERVSFRLEPNYWDTYPERMRALDVQSVDAASERYIRPQALTWVIIGDWARIEADVRALNLGEIRFISAEGVAQTP